MAQNSRTASTTNANETFTNSCRNIHASMCPESNSKICFTSETYKNRPNSFPSNRCVVGKSLKKLTKKKTLKNTYTTRGKWIDATFIQQQFDNIFSRVHRRNVQNIQIIL